MWFSMYQNFIIWVISKATPSLGDRFRWVSDNPLSKLELDSKQIYLN